MEKERKLEHLVKRNGILFFVLSDILNGDGGDFRVASFIDVNTVVSWWSECFGGGWIV
jgi:hypothetical protein